MSRRTAIVDTNVLVSGLMTGDEAAPTAQIVAGMLTARFPFLLSGALLDEYRSVLLRPAIAARHRLDTTELDTILLRLAQDAIVVEPSPPSGSAPDPGDGHLWALLAARPDAVLVTGDGLLQRRGRRGRVISPRVFVDSLRSGQRATW